MKNFKHTLATIVFAALASTVFAQFSIGAQGGIHLANWSTNEELNEDLEGLEYRLSPLVGVIAEFRFTENIAIQPELNFLQKGFKSEVNVSDSIFGDASGRTDYIISHIELPVLLKAGNDFGPIRVDGLVGPGFSYGLSGKVKSKFTFNGDTDTDTDEIDFKDDDFSRTDLSIHLGAMVTFNFSESAKLFVNTRYIMGLTNINAGDSPEEARNRGISLSAGVLIPM